MNAKVQVNAEGLTHVGQIRSSNQDALLLDSEDGLYIVADGMGGHVGGEIASKLCVDEIRNFLSRHRDQLASSDIVHPDQRISKMLSDAINHASTKIYERAIENPHLRGMGTTATLCQLVGNHAYIAHVGDSRCYLIRCGFIYQMTNDHSLVSEQVRAGIITKEEAASHHLRNVITRSVGYQEEEEVDTTCFILESNDLIILCSDGLYTKLSDKEISDIATTSGPNAVQKLVEIANDRGGEDNITVILTQINTLSSP